MQSFDAVLFTVEVHFTLTSHAQFVCITWEHCSYTCHHYCDMHILCMSPKQHTHRHPHT